MHWLRGPLGRAIYWLPPIKHGHVAKQGQPTSEWIQTTGPLDQECLWVTAVIHSITVSLQFLCILSLRAFNKFDTEFLSLMRTKLSSFIQANFREITFFPYIPMFPRGGHSGRHHLHLLRCVSALARILHYRVYPIPPACTVIIEIGEKCIFNQAPHGITTNLALLIDLKPYYSSIDTVQRWFSAAYLFLNICITLKYFFDNILNSFLHSLSHTFLRRSFRINSWPMLISV